MNGTQIEWTDATWNPVTGCTKLSPGCDHCYAETFAERWRGTPGHHFQNGFDLTLRPERLHQPLRWRRPRRIFVNSMSDLFHDDVPTAFIADVFAVMALSGRHTFQVLTKRHGRMRSLLGNDEFHQTVWRYAHALVNDGIGGDADEPPWPLPNVWLGVSVESQQWADIRIPALLDTPAAVRWLSCEPLLGSVSLRRWLNGGFGTVAPELHWVVVGGESGPGARPMHPDWARSLRDECVAAGVPWFSKQWGAFRPGGDPGRAASWVTDTGEIRPDLAGSQYTVPMVRVGKGAAGRELDGATWDQYPEAEA